MAKTDNPLKYDVGGGLRVLDFFGFTLASMFGAVALGHWSETLALATRVDDLDMWMLLAAGVLLGIIASSLRVLAHPHGGELDYWGKLFGIGAAVLAFWGVLRRMPTEAASFIGYGTGGISAFFIIAIIIGTIVEKVMHPTPKKNAPQLVQETTSAGA